MPVTAKLSRRFYERFGDDIANELVEWFNAVDATYKADLRELNDLNFARSDAKLEQRLAQFELKIERRFAQFEAKIEQRFVQIEAKFEQRFVQIEAKFEQRFAEFEPRFAQIEQRLAQLDQRITQLGADLRTEFTTQLADLRAKLMTWIVGLWITSVLGFAGIVLTLIRLR